MDSEKVKEIKEVLEMFAIDDKEMTLFQSPVPQSESCVKSIKYADILTLINELERENKELKRYKLDWLNGEKMHLQAEMEETEFELFCANKALKDRIAELESENERLKDEVKVRRGFIEDYEIVCDKKDKENQQLKTRIAELESENERLEKELKQVVLCNKGLQDGINEYQADNKEMGKSNQELKDRISELEKENVRLNKLFTYDKSVRDRCFDFIKYIKEEALKQFAERLKEKPHIKKIVDEGWIVSYVEICNDIDETLKEIMGE